MTEKSEIHTVKYRTFRSSKLVGYYLLVYTVVKKRIIEIRENFEHDFVIFFLVLIVFHKINGCSILPNCNAWLLPGRNKVLFGFVTCLILLLKKGSRQLYIKWLGSHLTRIFRLITEQADGLIGVIVDFQVRNEKNVKRCYSYYYVVYIL